MKISLGQSLCIAENAIKELAEKSGGDYVILRDRIIDAGSGWVFFYNTKEFVETGTPISALAGNGPIYVDQTGKTHYLSSAIPWQEDIVKYQSIID